ncbi:hypothetical protein ACKXGF_01610 [Alkalibacillus sp. S2W]|uniref:hypothetical protein n=1 Tax=Alkalibacillus TaxID=331654 RepID=UPI001420AD36|nr:hypothetical protein [Alkalibacillus almallahensis]NIK12114.1 hypothetical protein [Alkalibacillus almallahensis]
MPGVMIIYLTCVFGLFMLMFQFGFRYVFGMEATGDAIFRQQPYHDQKKRIQNRIMQIFIGLLLVSSLIETNISDIIENVFLILLLAYFFVSAVLSFIHNPESKEHWLIIINRILIVVFISFLIWLS